MKKALIDPNEPVIDPINFPQVLGSRVCEVQDTEFQVAAPLFWVDCADNITSMGFAYNDGVFVPIVYPEPTPKGQA